MNFNLYRTSFVLVHNLMKKQDLKLYHQMVENSKTKFFELENEQIEALRKIIAFVYEYVPFYKNHFNKVGLIPSDIKTIADLKYIPIIKKSTIKQNQNEFLPTKNIGKFINGSTGGSTGDSLKYRMSELDQALGSALTYRGWNYGGYGIGDPLLMLGGGSIVSKNLTFRKKVYHRLKNHYIASSYGMDNKYMESLISLIHNKKIKFIRGYASSIFLLAEYIQKYKVNKTKIESIKSIFSTAEMLYPQQRKIIEATFGVKVFNGYGLNDGGVSAYEDDLQNGFLIDTERAIMECVNERSENVIGIPGKIVATSLYNYHMPFIRYDTGDIGIISDEYINNGGNRFLLQNLLGRSNDYLEINGKKIGSPVLTVLMGKINARRYQFIQKSSNNLEIRIERDDLYNISEEEFIKKSIEAHVGKSNIEFIYGSGFINSENKHKFIIRDF
jgi:phenylacetate-CoA ligase